MAYTPPLSPIEFNFDAGYIAPKTLAFNFGVSEKDAYGDIHFALDDCAAAFVGTVPLRHVGFISATLDDCVGSVSASWLAQPKSLILQTNCVSKDAEKQISRVASSSRNAEIISHATDFMAKTAIKLNHLVRSKTQKAAVRSKRVKIVAQKANVIRKNQRCHVTDLHTYTHKFDTNLFKEPPVGYRYTPSATFDFGVHLNERTLSTTTQEYIAANPIAFDLIEAVHTGANNFDLSSTQTQAVTRTRQIFDNVSTYSPENSFFVAWSNDTYSLNHSYQRAALRIDTAAISNQAVVQQRNYRFANQNAIKLALAFSQRIKNAQKLAQNIQTKTQKAIKLAARYRFVLQIGRKIWNSNKSILITDPPRPPVIPPPINHVTVIIPTKQVYSMQHSITVTLEDLTPIAVDGVKLSLDNDSFAWSFSANLLDLSQSSLVTQTAETPPVVLIIKIDGTEFKMIVEKVTRNRSFAKNSIALSGRSLSAYLSSPYEMPRSATQSDALNVQQLCALELPSEWALNWLCADWAVPASAFSYTSKTPIQVITEIAANIGAVVVPSRNSKTLTVQPRYPVLPWNFAATTADLIIPDSAILSVSYRNITPTQANAVFVHGSEIGGVLSKCRLSGTAGDRAAATVTNALMTNVTGTRALGERILADSFEQPAIQSLTLSLGGDYPLVNVGDFLKINIDGGEVRGVVNSVGIDASLNKIVQTVQIGNESANVWAAFKQVMPSSPLLVGTVSKIVGNMNLVTLIDGGVNNVRGTGAAIGEKWYIRNEALESKAPNLVLSEVVI